MFSKWEWENTFPGFSSSQEYYSSSLRFKRCYNILWYFLLVEIFKESGTWTLCYWEHFAVHTQCGFHIENMSFTLISVSDSNDAVYWSTTARLAAFKRYLSAPDVPAASPISHHSALCTPWGKVHAIWQLVARKLLMGGHFGGEGEWDNSRWELRVLG